jgi:hypothetical protein
MKLCAGVLGWALVGLPGMAHAYCRTTTVERPPGLCPEPCITDGLPLYWSVPDAGYTLNARGFPDLSASDVRAVMARSFGHWNVIVCDNKPIGLNIQALPGTTTLEVGPEEAEPNANVVVYFSPERWDEDNLSDVAYALTAVWYRPSSGELLGADMHFNGTMGIFTICDDTGCEPGQIDLENVATHEAGHYIGLAHSDVTDSTMFCSAAPNEVLKRTLAPDDIAGACAVYPPDIAFRDLDLEGKWTPPWQSCALGQGGRPLASLFALAVGLVALGWRRRRR